MTSRTTAEEATDPFDDDDWSDLESVGVRDRQEIEKRDIGAGSRYKDSGLDFDEGLPVVDLRKRATPEPTPTPCHNEIVPVTKTPIPTVIANDPPDKKSTMDPSDFLSHCGTVPAVLTWEAVRKSALPVDAEGAIVSGLPESLEADVPPCMRFWKCGTKADALLVREALVESQIFCPETIRKVNGKLRRAVAESVIKLYLPPVYSDDDLPEVPESVRAIEKVAALLAPTDSDVRTTMFDHDVVEVVGLDVILAKVADLPGDWVICANDTDEVRKSLGDAFKLKSRDDLIFATSATLQDSESVEHIATTPGTEILKFALQEDRVIRIVKAAEERIIYGIVLEPDEVDSQGDTIPKEEIRKACHMFMEEFGNLGLQHNEIVDGKKLKLLENFIAPCDFEVAGQVVKSGSWLMKERVVDDAMWADVKQDNLTGFSIGGSAIRRPVK